MIERQTLDLLELNTGLVKAEKSEKKNILNQMEAMAEDRLELLSELAEKNPAEVLKVSYPEEIKKDLPKQVQDNLEDQVELKGALEILHIDNFTEGGEFVYFLRTKEETYTLYAEDEIDIFQSGTNVTV